MYNDCVSFVLVCLQKKTFHFPHTVVYHIIWCALSWVAQPRITRYPSATTTVPRRVSLPFQFPLARNSYAFRACFTASTPERRHSHVPSYRSVVSLRSWYYFLSFSVTSFYILSRHSSNASIAKSTAEIQGRTTIRGTIWEISTRKIKNKKKQPKRLQNRYKPRQAFIRMVSFVRRFTHSWIYLQMVLIDNPRIRQRKHKSDTKLNLNANR